VPHDLPPDVRISLSEPGGSFAQEVSPSAPLFLAATEEPRHLRVTVSGLAPPPSSDHVTLSCYPNPFSDRVGFRFRGVPDGEVSVEVLDLAGRLVARLRRDPVERGENVLVWEAQGAEGQPVAPGIYLVRWRAGRAHGEGRLVRLR
jgi:hypothetical protein